MNSSPEETKELISKSRPNLREVSVKQYEANLRKLKKLFNSDNYNFMKDPSKVKDKINDLHYTTQRNMYNAIIVLLMAIDDSKMKKLIETYSEMRDEGNQKYEEENKSGVISEKQGKNFTTMEELNSMIATLKKEVLPLKKKQRLTKPDISKLRAYVLFSMLTRIPTRNDASNMIYTSQKEYKRLSEKDKETTNYLVDERGNMKFIYNYYKTSKTYSENIVPVPKDLKPIMRMYIKLMDYKLGDNIFPMTKNALSQLLLKQSKRLINKSISSTLIRKIYLSSKYSGLKEEQEKDSKMMMHDISTQQAVYVKKDE
tara:strand:+ start:8851 stop:9792 length:942 start_codon:yes stop_codon:yes gene_type:complete